MPLPRRLPWIAILLITSPCTRGQGVPLKLDPGRAHEIEIGKDDRDGAVVIRTTGTDPYVYLEPFEPSTLPAGCSTLAFEVFCPDGIDGLVVYYGPPIRAGQFMTAGSTGRAESWMPFAIDLVVGSHGKWTPRHRQLRIDFGSRAGIKLRIRNLMLREPTAAESRSLESTERERQAKLVREVRLGRLYTQAFAGRIGSVVADGRQVQIRGAAPAGMTALRLIELRPWVSLGDQALDAPALTLASKDGILDHGPVTETGTFSRQLKRHTDTIDRVTSRFALATLGEDRRFVLRSAPRYVTDFRAVARHQLDRKTATGFKGMASVSPTYPLEELVELGVKHITANITLTNLVSTTPRTRWSAFESGGRTWYANPGALRHHDKLIHFATEHGMVVSAILLIAFGKGPFSRLLIHPEADRAGSYAMPDFSSRQGVTAYQAAITLLSRRYAQPGDPHGRITNWIIHNEVDYGWEWTNMGAQPPMLYFDTYMRSMRLVHNLVRRDNPHARVFISLTHNWNAPLDPKWRSYGSLPLLNRLILASRVEGDFAWGVGFHPYPQSLFKADAWNDTRVSTGFDTPLITPKNLEVLGRWMQRKESRDATGRVRGVLLSEQGFHTDGSPASERQQGAAFVYIWRKIRKLPMIEAFHNHRWIDHPAEGGLLLGVRTLPTADAPFGRKKFGWQVYRALDTPDEKAATGFADSILATQRGK